MSLSIFEYGDGRFRLFHGEREVGWIEGRAVAFVGFEGEEAAVRAAAIGYDALSEWLARQRHQDAAPRGNRRLRVRSEGGERALTLGGVGVGRLVSGPADHPADGMSHGFELLLPPRVAAAFTAAHVIHQALDRHGALGSAETESVAGDDEVLAAGMAR